MLHHPALLRRAAAWRVMPVVLAAGLILGALPVSCSPAPAEVQGSSLLLITIDTTRADALGCYGGPADLTPVMDALAAEGVRFDQARTVAPVTLPSHATILTGLLPFEHGVRDNATFRLPEDVPTLAERLKDAGYETLAVMSGFVLHSTFGLDQGFDAYSDVPQKWLTLGAAEDQRTAGEAVDEALRLLGRAKKGNQVFLWVHLFDPHHPYTPPAVFAQKAPAEGDATRRAYLGEVAYMDHEIGRLLAGVRDAVPSERLLTAVVADHGEGLGDHGESTHGFLLFEPTMRVPWILHHEGLPAGTVVSASVSTNDVAPTLLSLLGVAADRMTGRDLSALVEGEEAAPAAPAYFEGVYPYLNFNWSPQFGAVDGRYKLIDGPEPKMFDIQSDAGETHSILAEQSERADKIREHLRKLAARARPPERFTLSREEEERIRALGYAGSVGSGDGPPVPPGEVPEGLLDPVDGMALWDRCTQARNLAASGSPADLKESVALMRDILKQDPKNPAFQGYAGSVFFRAKLYSEAAAALEKSLETLESATSRETLASCFMNLGRMDDAIALLEVNAELHPYDLISRFKLGEALITQGRAREGLEHVEFFLQEHKAKDRLHAIAEEVKMKGLQRLAQPPPGRTRR